MDANLDGQVARRMVVFLAGYLILATIVTGYVFLSLWCAQSQVDVTKVTKDTCTGNSPSLNSLYPNQVPTGSATTIVATICNFPPASTAKLNGIPHPLIPGGGNRFVVSLTAADVVSTGTAALTLNDGTKDYGTGLISVVPPLVFWNFLWFEPWLISQEVQLLMMVLTIGAFASSVYQLKSLADYRGGKRLTNSWVTLYFIQPFEGAGIALLLYLVVRGGFLTASGTDAKSVNQFGMCAIAALGGAFSDTAFMKLNEVFNTLFKPQDDRGGKISGLKISTPNLPDGAVGTVYDQTLAAAGGTPPLKWSITPALPAALSLDPTKGTITGKPDGSTSKDTYTVTVTDSATPAAKASQDFTLQIQPASAGLHITTAALPDGKVNTAYPSTTLQSAGGTGNVTWTVVAPPALPAGLAIAAGGVLSGTPTAPAARTRYKLTVTDSANPQATATAYLTFEVKA